MNELVEIYNAGIPIMFWTGILSITVHFALSLCEMIRYYSYHREFDWYTLDDTLEEDWKNWFRFPGCFGITIIVFLLLLFAVIVWPLCMLAVTIYALGEVAYKLNGPNRLAAELKGELQEK